MKPATFRHYAPGTVDEALELLAAHADEGKILAGGQSLVPLLNMRLATPPVLIDINRVRGLGGILESEDGGLRIGALTRHRELERSDLLRRRMPMLVEAARCIGHTAIRTRGTIGGSVTHADPAAELPGVVTALEGRIRIRGGGRERWAAPGDFFVGPCSVSLDPVELVTEVALPPVPPGAGWSFEEVTRRHGDFALVGVAILLGIDGADEVTYARVGVIGAGPVPIRAAAAERVLVGERASDTLFQAASRTVAEGVAPSGDLHASAEYRRHLAEVLTRRGLAAALGRARAGRRPDQGER